MTHRIQQIECKCPAGVMLIQFLWEIINLSESLFIKKFVTIFKLKWFFRAFIVWYKWILGEAHIWSATARLKSSLCQKKQTKELSANQNISGTQSFLNPTNTIQLVTDHQQITLNHTTAYASQLLMCTVQGSVLLLFLKPLPLTISSWTNLL